MSILNAYNLSIKFGSQADNLFEGVLFEIDKEDKVGLIGPNGCGKTTLLRILAGELSPDKGKVIMPNKGLQLGYMRQETWTDSEKSLLEEAESVFEHLIRLREEMEMFEIELQKRSHEDVEDILESYGRLQEEFQVRGGYDFEHKTESVLFGLGFDERALRLRFRDLSSGQRTRAQLAKLLLQAPDLLLLDEPTNHLDIRGIEWLEDYLERYEKAALIVCHDRYFLDRVVTRIFELRRGKLTEYSGNYSFYVAERDLRERQASEDYERKKKEEKRLRKAVAERKSTARKVASKPRSKGSYYPKQSSFFKAKAAKVQRRAKVIERRIEKIEITLEKPFVEKKMKIEFQDFQRSSDTVLSVKNLSKSFDENRLFEGISFYLMRGKRVAIIGPNGSGKTTLLKILLGEEGADEGQVDFGCNVKVGYQAQEHQGLSPEKTILEEALSVSNGDETWTRTVLGSLMLRKEKVYDRIGTLSLGERGRVVLAKLLLSGANFLILDEPMNHLDTDAREVVESALGDYPGTILFVSHDRRFIEKLADEILEIEAGTVQHYPGRYQYYVEKKHQTMISVTKRKG